MVFLCWCLYYLFVKRDVENAATCRPLVQCDKFLISCSIFHFITSSCVHDCAAQHVHLAVSEEFSGSGQAPESQIQRSEARFVACHSARREGEAIGVLVWF